MKHMNDLKMIKEFSGEHRWLSNFALVDIELRGIVYASVEHAYMSEKNKSDEWLNLCSDRSKTPGQIKRASKDIELRKDWEDVKLLVMEHCLKKKFTQEPFRTKLIETNGQVIQEGNTWGDVFWGVCLETDEGENHLGRLIMEIRNKLIMGKL